MLVRRGARVTPARGFFAQHRRFVLDGGMFGGCLAFRVEFSVSGVFFRGSTAFDGFSERSESCASEAGPTSEAPRGCRACCRRGSGSRPCF